MKTIGYTEVPEYKVIEYTDVRIVADWDKYPKVQIKRKTKSWYQRNWYTAFEYSRHTNPHRPMAWESAHYQLKALVQRQPRIYTEWVCNRPTILETHV